MNKYSRFQPNTKVIWTRKINQDSYSGKTSKHEGVVISTRKSKVRCDFGSLGIKNVKEENLEILTKGEK